MNNFTDGKRKSHCGWERSRIREPGGDSAISGCLVLACPNQGIVLGRTEENESVDIGIVQVASKVAQEITIFRAHFDGVHFCTFAPIKEVDKLPLKGKAIHRSIGTAFIQIESLQSILDAIRNRSIQLFLTCSQRKQHSQGKEQFLHHGLEICANLLEKSEIPSMPCRKKGGSSIRRGEYTLRRIPFTREKIHITK